MPFQRVAAVIFDMDGLLFDTERLYAEAMMAAAVEMGASLKPAAIHRTIGLPAADCGDIWAEYFPPDFDVDAFWLASSANFKMQAETRLTLKAGAIELLDLLENLNLPRAIATSSDRATVDHHLDKAGIAERFNAIIAFGDYAEGKPHPAPYIAAATRLDVDPAICLALEDSYNGVRSAAAAGMITIMVPDLLEATQEMHELSLQVVRDLHDVCALFADSAS
ncbi:MAG: HAD family phosphatase [Erythrobacter sp.]|nr:HAD family phosphatase [Erythrobacter sp.]